MASVRFIRGHEYQMGMTYRMVRMSDDELASSSILGDPVLARELFECYDNLKTEME